MQILKKNNFLRILSSTQRTQKLIIINRFSRPTNYTTNASKDEPVKYSASKYNI